MIGPQIGHDAGIKQRIFIPRLAAQEGGNGVIDLGDPVDRAGDHVEGQHRVLGKGRTHLRQRGIKIRAEHLIQKGHGFGIAVKLAEDLHPRDGRPARQLQRPAHLGGEQRLGTLEIAHHRKGQRLVIAGEGAKPALLGQLVEYLQRGAHVALAHLRPGHGQPVHKRPRAAILGHAGQQGVERARARLGRAQHHAGDLALQPVRFHLLRNGQGAVQIAQRQVGQHRVFQQHRVGRIACQRAGEVIRRHRVITQDHRLPRRQIGAGMRLCLGHAARCGPADNCRAYRHDQRPFRPFSARHCHASRLNKPGPQGPAPAHPCLLSKPSGSAAKRNERRQFAASVIVFPLESAARLPERRALTCSDSSARRRPAG